MTGYVYALTNPDYPGSFKIGMTTKTPDERAKQLSSGTGVRSPFSVFCANQTPFPDVHERAIHLILSDYRDSPSKEFFSAPPDVIIRTFDEMSEAIRLYRWWLPGMSNRKEPLDVMVPPMDEKDLQTPEAKRLFRKAEALELNDDGTCPYTRVQASSPWLSVNIRYPKGIVGKGQFFQRTLRTGDPDEALEQVRIYLKCLALELDNDLVRKGIQHD